MTRKVIDDERVRELYRESPSARRIADRLGFAPGAIHRSLVRLGLKDPPPNRKRKMNIVHHATAANDGAPEAREERTTCFRCGVRSDVGCGCSKQRLGWSTL